MQTINTTGSSKSNKLKYLPDNSVILDMPFILTRTKRLVKGMPYLKLEKWLVDSKIEAVCLLDVWDADDIVYLRIQGLQTNKSEIISFNLAYDGDYWLWSLASLDFLINLQK